jgi:hypothetical protein
MKIVETDNMGGDYPSESFVELPVRSKEACEAIAKIINDECSGNYAPRFWKVVEDDYKLAPGFEP